MLCFGPAACCCDLEFLFRLTLIDVVLLIEARKILTDDLIRFVALAAFCPGIPTGNPSLRLQHGNRVVLDPVEERPIFFFAVPERLLCKPASGVVALDAPARGNGDQQAQDGSENQTSIGLA